MEIVYKRVDDSLSMRETPDGMTRAWQKSPRVSVSLGS